MGCQSQVLTALPPEWGPVPLYRRPGGPQGRSGRERKISTPIKFDPRTVQPAASCYTDWASHKNHNYVTCKGTMNFKLCRWSIEYISMVYEHMKTDADRESKGRRKYNILLVRLAIKVSYSNDLTCWLTQCLFRSICRQMPDITFIQATLTSFRNLS